MATEEVLPLGWERVSLEDGDYYVNEAAGETRLDRPLQSEEEQELAEDGGEVDDAEDDGFRDCRAAQLDVECREVRAHPEDPRLAIATVRDGDSEVLSFVPEGAQASLSCSPGILFHLQEIHDLEPVDETTDGEYQAKEIEIVLRAVDPGWRGVEAMMDGITIAAIFAGSDLEEALFASRNHLLRAEDKVVDRDKMAEVLWDADELLACAADLFPEAIGDMLSSDLEAALADSSLLDVASSEAEGKTLICFKNVHSPLEDTAMREFYLGQDKSYKASEERPWPVIADALQDVLGMRNADLDRRFLSESPQLQVSRAEASEEYRIRLRFPEGDERSQDGHHERREMPKPDKKREKSPVVRAGRAVKLTAAADRARSQKDGKERPRSAKGNKDRKEGHRRSLKERERVDRSKANGRRASSQQRRITHDSHRSREPRLEDSQRRRDADRRMQDDAKRERPEEARRSNDGRHPKDETRERRSQSAHGERNHKTSRPDQDAGRVRKEETRTSRRDEPRREEPLRMREARPVEEVVLKPRELSRSKLATHGHRDGHHERQRRDEDRHKECGRDGHTRPETERPRERKWSPSSRDRHRESGTLDTRSLEERLRALQHRPVEGRSRSRRGSTQESSRGPRAQAEPSAKQSERRVFREEPRRVGLLVEAEKRKAARRGEAVHNSTAPVQVVADSKRSGMPLPSQAPKVQLSTSALAPPPAAVARMPLPSSRLPSSTRPTAAQYPLPAALAGPRPPSTPPPGYRGPLGQTTRRVHGQ